MTRCFKVWPRVVRCGQLGSGVVASVSLSGSLSQTRPGKQANNENSVGHFSAVCKLKIVCHVAPTTKNTLSPSHTKRFRDSPIMPDLCIAKLVYRISWRAHTFEPSVRIGKTCLGYTKLSRICQNFIDIPECLGYTIMSRICQHVKDMPAQSSSSFRILFWERLAWKY